MLAAPRAGRPHTFGDDEHLLPVRLAWRPCADVRESVRHGHGVAPERLQRGPRRRVSARSTVSVRPTLSTLTSRARSVCSTCTPMARLVTSAVTKGLPSRSPPTQEPNRMNAGTGLGTVPLASPTSARSVTR